jgi:hypothetical protein
VQLPVNLIANSPRYSLAADEVGERLPLAHQVGFAVLDQHFGG